MFTIPPEKPTYFLQSKHKKRLVDNIDHAIVIWSRLIHSARNKSMEQEWKQAVIYYGNAFEVADIILSHAREKNEVNRYIRTAVEFIYALRHSHYQVDFSYLINEVQETIQQQSLTTHSKFIIKPLNDMAFSPIKDIERWITVIYNLDRSEGSSYHSSSRVIH